MAEITEDYVSFETAKLLKEKGFDEYCPLWYNLDKPIEGPFFYKEIGWYGHNSYDYNGKRIVSAPTHQMAMKWLREVHNLVICAEIGNENFKGNTDYSNPDRWYWFFDITNEKGVVIDTEGAFTLNEYATYEEACEAGIKYCLENLI